MTARSLSLPLSRNSDARRVVDASGLPEACRRTVLETVGRSGLRPSERADVARELCSHFAEGIAAGADPTAMVHEFGDTSRAARLIGRAVKRKRGWLYHARRRALQAGAVCFGLLVASYLILLARFNFIEPTIRRQYVAELNARIDATPQADRAWPRYAVLLDRWTHTDPPDDSSFPDVQPGDADYERALAELRSNTPLLAPLREAANLPVLGLRFGRSVPTEIERFQTRTGRAEAAGLAPGATVSAPVQSDQNIALIEVLLPQLSIMRTFGRTLRFDMMEAARAGDGDRIVADARAMVGMADQLREPQFLICDLVCISISALAYDGVGQVLRDHPEALSDRHLADLAHILAARPRDLHVRFDMERAGFMDVVQRTYSDDGSGGGVVTAAGMREMERVLGAQGDLGRLRQTTGTAERLVSALASPVAAGLMADRRSLVGEYNRALAEYEPLSGRAFHLWPVDFASPEPLAGMSEFQRSRYELLDVLLPALSSAVASGNVATQQREGVLVAIALELHRRRTGSFPDSLSDLAPTLLPSVPVDQYSGGPLGYVLRDGRPVIYSVGVDRVDDGGVPPAGEDGVGRASRWISAPLVAQRLSAERLAASEGRSVPEGEQISGDWVLWPPQR